MENGGLSCFVDSVISPYKVRTSEEVGGWSCDYTLENGIYIKAPGIWDSLPRTTLEPSPSWEKHSGMVTNQKLGYEERKQQWIEKHEPDDEQVNEDSFSTVKF